MNINLIQLLEQFKKFIQQENGSGFSLLLYLLLGVFIGDRILLWMFKYNVETKYMILVGAVIFIICVIIWWKARKLPKKNGAINIGIADVIVIALGDATFVNFEQKSQLAIEASALLSSEISNIRLALGSKSLSNVIKLPSRIAVGFDNDRTIVDALGLDILVWGTLKVHAGQYFLNYKLTFGKRIESRAFTQLIQCINNVPEIEFDVHGVTDRCSVFIKQLLCISTLLQSINEMQKGHYLLVNALLKEGLEYIEGLGHDKKYPIHFLLKHLLYYVGMKNNRELYEYYLSLKEDASLLNLTKKQIANNFNMQLKALKDYYEHMERNNSHDKSFQLEWLRILSMTPEETKIIDMMDAGGATNSMTEINELMSGYIAMHHGSLIDARLVYQSILIDRPGDLLALRSLGFIDYGLKQYATSKLYLQEYTDNQKKHIFYTHMYDTKVFYTLCMAYLKTWCLRRALKYFVSYLHYSWKNRALRKKYIIL